MDLKQYGGEALRSMASHGNQLLVEYLIQNGADINYHKPDMVFPYASTPVTEAARYNDFSMVRWLVEQGADITIPRELGLKAAQRGEKDHYHRRFSIGEVK